MGWSAGLSPRLSLRAGEPEIDVEACEAGEAANLFSGAAHRLRLQKVRLADMQPHATRTAAPRHPGCSPTPPRLQPCVLPECGGCGVPIHVASPAVVCPLYGAVSSARSARDPRAKWNPRSAVRAVVAG